MLNASNDFYNFVLDSYNKFMENNGVPLKVAWEMYKNYCDDAKVQYPFSMRIFREELRNYFEEYHERYILEDGTRARSYYHGFKDLNVSEESQCESDNRIDNGWLSMKSQPSVLDDILKTNRHNMLMMTVFHIKNGIQLKPRCHLLTHLYCTTSKCRLII